VDCALIISYKQQQFAYTARPGCGIKWNVTPSRLATQPATLFFQVLRGKKRFSFVLGEPQEPKRLLGPTRSAVAELEWVESKFRVVEVELF